LAFLLKKYEGLQGIFATVFFGYFCITQGMAIGSTEKFMKIKEKMAGFAHSPI
jgi:hypothetical protein